MLIRDKVPPRFRSHFCFVSRFLLGGVILLRRKTRFRPYLENGTVTTLWLGSSSRAGLAPAACRFIEKFTVPFFFNRRRVLVRGGGAVGMGGRAVFFCLIGEQGLKHKG